MSIAQQLAQQLICPDCHGPLRADGDILTCPACEARFEPNAYGYYDFIGDPALEQFDTTSDDYAEEQKRGKERFFREFLEPWLHRETAHTVLEVGTGMGMEIGYLNDQGHVAYGIDVPCLAPRWDRLERDPARFFCGNGSRMPFPDGFFDAVFTLGVIEHIGTAVGHYTLAEGYEDARRAFAEELVRVSRPNGRILVTCPNKHFPVDIAHEPTDAATPPGALRWRRWFYDRTGMTVHPPFGRYHLLSWGELGRLFMVHAGARGMATLPMKGYFAFERFGAGPLGALRGLLAAYVDNMPAIFRASPLNPFLVVEVRR